MSIVIDDSKKLGFIDALRGIAVLLVLNSHIFKPYELAWSCKIAKLIGVGEWIGFIFITGGWGVFLFFILSGFVLYRPYFLQQRSFDSWQSVFDFYKKRFFRLYPLLAFNYLIAFFFIAKPSLISFKDFFLTLTTLSIFNIGSNLGAALNPVLWSLVMEVWFSLLFPLIVFFIYKYGFRNVFIFVFILAFISRFLSTYYQDNLLSFNLILGRVDDFFWGMVLCKFYYEKHKIFHINFLKLFSLFLILYISGAFIAELMCCKSFKSVLFIKPFCNNIMQLSFGCLLVFVFQVKKFFDMWLLRLLGAMCYSIYVWHWLLMPVFLDFTYFNFLHIIIYFFFMFSFSALSYRYIEFGKEKSLKKLFLLE